MNQSFRDRRLRALFLQGSRRGIGAREAEKVELILHQLHRATSIDDLRLPGFHLHELRGNRAGTWSIRVTRNWRITFRFEDGDAYDIDYEDYH